jgi:hypothetical protein
LEELESSEEIRRRDHGFKRDRSTIELTEEHEASRRPLVEEQEAKQEEEVEVDESDDDDDDDEEAKRGKMSIDKQFLNFFCPTKKVRTGSRKARSLLNPDGTLDNRSVLVTHASHQKNCFVVFVGNTELKLVSESKLLLMLSCRLRRPLDELVVESREVAPSDRCVAPTFLLDAAPTASGASDVTTRDASLVDISIGLTELCFCVSAVVSISCRRRFHDGNEDDDDDDDDGAVAGFFVFGSGFGFGLLTSPMPRFLADPVVCSSTSSIFQLGFRSRTLRPCCSLGLRAFR